MAKKNRRRFIIIGLIIILIIGGFIYRNSSKEDKPIQVFVIPIEAKTIVQKISASGTIQPEKSIDISANISALIMRIFVDDGDSVMMGQNLISLDKTRYEAFAEQAASRLRSAEANLEKTKSLKDREEKLFDLLETKELPYNVKGFDSEYLDSMEVVNVPNNPQVQEEDEILKNILGTPANWRDYKQAHLFFNENQDQMKEGYYIRIGRRLDTDDILNATPEKGKIVVFKDLLDLAVDHLNGRYGRPPITEDERRSAYQVIKQYFDILKMDAPVLLDSYLSFDSKKKDSEELTNFPKKGDNKKISLRNSNHRTFDPDYAEKLKLNYPSIWRAGGNIRGNEQYKKLYPIAKRGGVPKNLSEERAIKLREAWIARHHKDLSLIHI